MGDTLLHLHVHRLFSKDFIIGVKNRSTLSEGNYFADFYLNKDYPVNLVLSLILFLSLMKYLLLMNNSRTSERSEIKVVLGCLAYVLYFWSNNTVSNAHFLTFQADSMLFYSIIWAFRAKSIFWK